MLRSRSKGCAVVVGPAVELDDELVLWPENVDLVAGDVLVDPRAREPVPVDEGEERVLECRARRSFVAVDEGPQPAGGPTG